jgi:hypothetical protein
VDLGRAFVWMAPSGRAFLLTWLILALVAPAPAVLSGGADCVGVSGSGAEDGAPGDTSPAEDETPQDIAPGSVLERTRGSGRPEAFASFVGPPQGPHLSPRPGGQRPGSTHLPDDGRTLRLRLRSLTC